MEVVQETFLKLYQEDASQLNGRLGQWLYTVCRNQAVDVRRKESRVVTWSESPAVADGRGDSSLDAELQDDLRQVLQAISQLPPNQQECIRLKFQQGLSYKQISAVTGHSTTNVGFLIHVGMKTLRQRLCKPQVAQA
jgi:RNA polymerase sigma-70 factor (ECF subfamily)